MSGVSKRLVKGNRAGLLVFRVWQERGWRCAVVTAEQRHVDREEGTEVNELAETTASECVLGQEP